MPSTLASQEFVIVIELNYVTMKQQLLRSGFYVSANNFDDNENDIDNELIEQ
jgi:hypothetical protein